MDLCLYMLCAHQMTTSQHMRAVMSKGSRTEKGVGRQYGGLSYMNMERVSLVGMCFMGQKLAKNDVECCRCDLVQADAAPCSRSCRAQGLIQHVQGLSAAGPAG